jgi:hypothetical protein
VTRTSSLPMSPWVITRPLIIGAVSPSRSFAILVQVVAQALGVALAHPQATRRLGR